MEMEVFDLRRMLLGDLPWTFMLEIAVRTAVMYSYAFLLVRMAGSRTVSQLSLVELLLVIALGSAVGDPMFYPEVPLLHGLVVVTVVIGLNVTLNELTGRSERLEQLVEGATRRVLQDGVVDMGQLRQARLAPEELYEQLRVAGVEQLGQVRAAYAEQNGNVSVFRHSLDDEVPGLPIEPPLRIANHRSFTSGGMAPRSGRYACEQCGETRYIESGDSIPVGECGGRTWLDAVHSHEYVRRAVQRSGQQ